MPEISNPPIVSVTEVNSFRECKRKWYLFDVRNLHPKIEPAYFWLGKGMHFALEEYWKHGRQVADATSRLRKYFLQSTATLEVEYGPALWSEIAEEYFNTYMNGLQMLENYAIFDHESMDLGKPVHIEERFRVPIIEKGPSTVFGWTPFEDGALLSGKFDLVTTTPDERDFIMVDHKIQKQKWATGEVLDIDEQLTGYGYEWYRATASVIRELVHDVLMVKEQPMPPVLLKNGTLSIDQNQKTTYYHFVKEAELRGISIYEPRYAAYLEKLRMKGWSDYFYRERTSRNLTQLLNYERRLAHTYREMQAIKADPSLAFPSPNAMKCSRCQYLSVCHAMEDGGDAEAMIEVKYKVEAREK